MAWRSSLHKPLLSQINNNTKTIHFGTSFLRSGSLSPIRAHSSLAPVQTTRNNPARQRMTQRVATLAVRIQPLIPPGGRRIIALFLISIECRADSVLSTACIPGHPSQWVLVMGLTRTCFFVPFTYQFRFLRPLFFLDPHSFLHVDSTCWMMFLFYLSLS